MVENYRENYHGWPVYSEELFHEGSFKRFTEFPQPKETLEFALMGLPKVFPLTGEPITPALIEPHLNSAITEIEMELGCNLSTVTHKISEDYIDGMFTNNYMGIRLHRWPATEVIQMQLKYPHTNTDSTFQKYTLPPSWIYLRRNKLNVVAAIGSVTVSTDNSALVTAGGIFTYITGFGRGAYQPGTIEVTYRAGFAHDKMPSSVADLIKTWAAVRFLADVQPVLFPQSGVQVGIDGVNQNVQFSVTQSLAQRIEKLEQKKQELKANFAKQFAKTIKMVFIGS